jgi:hypothetical protein
MISLYSLEDKKKLDNLYKKVEKEINKPLFKKVIISKKLRPTPLKKGTVIHK